jgi:phosphate transport system substrate-binding protein
MALRRSKPLFLLALVIAALAVVAAGCGGGSDEGSSDTEAPTTEAAPAAEATTEEAPAEESGGTVSGTIEADGSSTVGPLTTAAAELFQAENPDTVVTVGISGTGGGFERFCAGETDLSDASRPIADDEAPICAENGVEYTEFQVATDALTVIVNSENDWVDCLTVEQLNTIWGPEAEGTITNWNQVDPSFPDEPLVLAGPGTDSGTFDYFTDVINGEEGASRADYTASEDDNVIVQAVSGETGGLGYLGFTYYEQNADTLKAVQIDGGGGCVAPSAETAQDGSYTPLARPLFVYANNAKLTGENPALAPFMQFYLDNNATIAEAALYIPMNEEIAAEQQAKLQTALGG